MAKTTGGEAGQFTYDFGISIAQSTVAKVAALAGASLTLASAFYALQNVAVNFVDAIKTNTLQFGGQLGAIQAMEKAQKNLLKGLSKFSVDEQLEGMNKLRAAGIDVRKDMEFYEKVAHATGQEFTQFASTVNSAIAGNMSGLVEMGLMTERAAKRFSIYEGNTVMMQAAVTRFLKGNKMLVQAIANDFDTVQDQMGRISENWTMLLQNIVGKPNDPGSFYQQVVGSLKSIADVFEKHGDTIRQWGFAIGQVLGWVVKNVAHFINSVMTLAGKMINNVWKTTDKYQESVYKMIVVLEFWKLHIIKQFKTVFKFMGKHKGLIMGLIKMVLLYKTIGMSLKLIKWGGQGLAVAGKAMKNLFFSIQAYAIPLFKKDWKALKGLIASESPKLTKAIKSMGAGFRNLIHSGPTIRGFFDRVGVASKRCFSSIGRGAMSATKAIRNMGPALSNILTKLKPTGATGWLSKIPGILKNVLRLLPSIAAWVSRIWKVIAAGFTASNPVGWIIAAITLFVILFTKVKAYRDFVIAYLRLAWEAWKMMVNISMFLGLKLMQGVKIFWGWLKQLGSWIVQGVNWLIKGMGRVWDAFKDTTVGKWLTMWIFNPISNFFSSIWDGIEWIGKLLDFWVWSPMVRAFKWLMDKLTKVGDFLSGIADWFKGANATIEAENNRAMRDLGINRDAPAYPSSDFIKGLSPEERKERAKKAEAGKPISIVVPGTKGVTKNPIIVERDISPFTPQQQQPAPLALEKGAITINIAKGEGINEIKLASRIKKELFDLQMRDFNRKGLDNNKIYNV